MMTVTLFMMNTLILSFKFFLKIIFFLQDVFDFFAKIFLENFQIKNFNLIPNFIHKNLFSKSDT